MLRRYIGDKAFYRRVLAIALPIIGQNAITNFVSLLDNLMVGQLSTAQISAVTIANNNLLFIFNLCLFGGAAGAGIFTTQFFGSYNHEGIRHTFRFKILICLSLALAAAGIFLIGSDSLIGQYLQGEGDAMLAADTLRYCKEYLLIMLLGLIPFALTNAYASTLRECAQPMVPMLAGLAATAVNLVLNYILIFGKLGVPAMGVSGAAIATVISRYVEFCIIAVWTHTHSEKLPFIKEAYRSMYIPGKLLKPIFTKGMPLLLNEVFWSFGMAILNQSYSYCSLDVLPALSISTTLYNLSGVVFRSFGNTVGIITGQMLGANSPESELRDSNRKMTALCVASGVVFAAFMAGFSEFFPKLYNTSDSVRELARWFIIISAVYIPLNAYFFPVYFTLRAGGRTIATFLFESGAVWALNLPLAFVLSHFSSLPILTIFAICNSVDIIKCFVGYYMIKKGSWIQNLAIK